MIGKIKWFDNDKGYGFIKCESLADIFVHYTAISKEGYKCLNEHDIVEFKLVKSDKGLRAINVKIIEMALV